MSTTTTARSTLIGKSAYDRLMNRTREAQLLQASANLIHWDQEVMMPKKGIDFRSRQLSLLARLHHEQVTDPAVEELLLVCEADADLTGDPRSVSAVNLRELRRSYDRQTRLPASLVEEEARLTSLSQHVWAEARREADFNKFRPHLEQIVDLLRRKASMLRLGQGRRAMECARRRLRARLHREGHRVGLHAAARSTAGAAR